MNEQITKSNDTIEIDLKRILDAVMHKAGLIVLVSVLCAVVAFLGTFFFVTPKYQASAKFYVNNKSANSSNSGSVTSSDLTTSRNLVDSYIVILKTRESLNQVITHAGVDRTYARVRSMISAAAVDGTEFFQVTVTSADPQEAEKIANAIADILPGRIAEIMDGTSAKVAEAAVVPTKPSSPSYAMNTAIGFLLAFVLTVLVIVLQEIFDTTIRTEDDVNRVCQYPILAEVPDMTVPSKGTGYYSKAMGKNQTAGKHLAKEPGLIGGEVSFAAAEAYKLLRTKLQFSFADDNDCRVIGVSSALSGEGKSLSSINLAYTLSELGKKVVLVDCDMRRPTLGEKLGIRRQPGLSSYLTRQADLVNLIQPCGIKNSEKAFHVVTAGQIPPNPIELLSSQRMAAGIKTLRTYYDYVILDLPPVGEVSDAMAVAKETDGTLLVARQNYCNRVAFADTIRQFEFINAKILGVVINCATENTGKYGKSYYKKYGKNYENSYMNAARRAKGRR